jgi:hypothetical protein
MRLPVTLLVRRTAAYGLLLVAARHALHPITDRFERLGLYLFLLSVFMLLCTRRRGALVALLAGGTAALAFTLRPPLPNLPPIVVAFALTLLWMTLFTIVTLLLLEPQVQNDRGRNGKECREHTE